MRRSIASFVLLAWAATGIHAQPQRRATGGRTKGKPPAVSPAKSAPAPKMSQQQQSNVKELTADLQALRDGSSVTPAQKQALAADLMALADGATKPDPALVDELANDLSDALADGELSQKETVALAKDIEQVMNSANISAEELNAVVKDAQAILVASGVSKADAQEIAGDLKAIGAELQKNH